MFERIGIVSQAKKRLVSVPGMLRAHIPTGATARTWSVLEWLSKFSVRRELEVEWSDVWSEHHDRALEELPDLTDREREYFRILAQPTEAPKRHAIVRRSGETVAVVSVRKRGSFWEPVSAGCMADSPIPCQAGQLGDVLKSLRLEVRVPALLSDPSDLSPQLMYGYDLYGADLTADWEAHWPTQGGMNYRTARKRTVGMESRFDAPGDVEWVIDQWSLMWLNNPTDEVAAGQDRSRLWPVLKEDGIVHSVVLTDEGRPVAGCVHYEFADGVIFECTARDQAYDKRRVGTRVLDISFEWAANSGYQTFDLGGGGAYKHWWAPVNGIAYVAIFRPPLIDALRRGGAWLRDRFSNDSAESA